VFLAGVTETALPAFSAQVNVLVKHPQCNPAALKACGGLDSSSCRNRVVLFLVTNHQPPGGLPL
jgi:hypothetical protein